MYKEYKILVNYQKKHGSNGTVYNQTIKLYLDNKYKNIDDMLQFIKDRFDCEIILTKNTYIRDNIKLYDNQVMKYTNNEIIIYLKLTQLDNIKNINIFKNNYRIKKDRNTILILNQINFSEVK